MKVTIENLALCDDCAIVAVNADYSGLSWYGADEDKRIEEINKGLSELGPHLVHDDRQEPDEFSTIQCDCCKSKLAGRREYFCILGE